MNRISIVIPNINGDKYLENCLVSLKRQTFTDFEVILVDNGSTDNSIEICRSVYPDIKVISNLDNTGFSHAVNQGIKAAEGEYVILLNNDTVAAHTYVEKLYEAISSQDDIFSCSSLMLQYNDRNLVDDSGDYFCALGWAFTMGKDRDYHGYLKSKRVFAACGGASIYRKSVFEEIGYFDEDFFAYIEDIDVGYRALLKGYTNLYVPEAKVCHVGSAHSGSRHNAFKVSLAARNSIYMMAKNMPLWQFIINMPIILTGIAIKTVYFQKKGLRKDYLNGIKDAVRFINTKHPFKAPKADVHKCVKVQKELIINMVRRIM